MNDVAASVAKDTQTRKLHDYCKLPLLRMRTEVKKYCHRVTFADDSYHYV